MNNHTLFDSGQLNSKNDITRNKREKTRVEASRKGRGSTWRDRKRDDIGKKRERKRDNRGFAVKRID